MTEDLSKRILQMAEFYIGPDALKESAEKKWKRWLKAVGENIRISDVKDFLALDVRDEFKARALTVLFAPANKHIPFTWSDKETLPNKGNVQYLFMNTIDITKLSPSLHLFLASLICTILEEKDLSLEDAELKVYNVHILELLTVLPSENTLTKRLFNHFYLRDLVPYKGGVADPSGYTPFRYLLAKEKLPEKWKNAADQKMRTIVLAELSGKQTPRKSWEAALQCYADCILKPLGGNYPTYSAVLFASQLGFILDLPNITQQQLIPPSSVEHIFYKLSSEVYRPLRHRIARWVILGHTDQFGAFSIESPLGLVMAHDLLTEFADDPELKSKVQQLIENSDWNRITQSNRMEARKLAIESALLKMS